MLQDSIIRGDVPVNKLQASKQASKQTIHSYRQRIKWIRTIKWIRIIKSILCTTVLYKTTMKIIQGYS